MNRAPGVCRVIKGHVASRPEHSGPGLVGDQWLGRTGGDTHCGRPKGFVPCSLPAGRPSPADAGRVSLGSPQFFVEAKASALSKREGPAPSVHTHWRLGGFRPALLIRTQGSVRPHLLCPALRHFVLNVVTAPQPHISQNLLDLRTGAVGKHHGHAPVCFEGQASFLVPPCPGSCPLPQEEPG